MKPNDLVTTDTLRKYRACPEQVKLFKLTFPDGAQLTLENLQAAAKAGLDVDWFAMLILRGKARDAYYQATAPAREAYEQAEALAEEAYQQAKAQARATSQAWDAYLQAEAQAWGAYDQATAPARVAYLQAEALALWEAINQEER